MRGQNASEVKERGSRARPSGSSRGAEDMAVGTQERCAGTRERASQIGRSGASSVVTHREVLRGRPAARNERGMRRPQTGGDVARRAHPSAVRRPAAAAARNSRPAHGAAARRPGPSGGLRSNSIRALPSALASAALQGRLRVPLVLIRPPRRTASRHVLAGIRRALASRSCRGGSHQLPTQRQPRASRRGSPRRGCRRTSLPEEGGVWCAASPASSSRSRRQRPATSEWKV